MSIFPYGNKSERRISGPGGPGSRGCAPTLPYRAECDPGPAAGMEGIGQPYLSKLESGGFGSSLNHALRLLRLLGCEIVVRKRSKSG